MVTIAAIITISMTDQSKGIYQIKYNLQMSSIPSDSVSQGLTSKMHSSYFLKALT